MARIGSSIPFTGPQPVIGISNKLIRKTEFDIFRRKQHLNWLRSKGQSQAKELNQSYPNARHKELFKLNRNGMSKVIGLLTGHCLLRKHLTIMAVKNDPLVRVVMMMRKRLCSFCVSVRHILPIGLNILVGIFLSLGNCMTSQFVVC